MAEIESRVSAMEFQIAEFQAQLQSVSQTMNRMEDKLTRVDETLTTIRQQTQPHTPTVQVQPAQNQSNTWYDRIVAAILGLAVGTGGTAGIGSLIGHEQQPQYQPQIQYYQPPPRDLQAPRPDPTVPTYPQ